MRIYKSIKDPIRENLSLNERLRDFDNGIILAWEVGRKRALNEPDLVNKTLNRELPVLGYYGGHEKKLTGKNLKYGSFKYLAEWLGLRGEDLDIDIKNQEGMIMICSKTNMQTQFTNDSTRFEG